MSFVGPRPERPFFVEQYLAEIARLPRAFQRQARGDRARPGQRRLRDRRPSASSSTTSSTCIIRTWPWTRRSWPRPCASCSRAAEPDKGASAWPRPTRTSAPRGVRRPASRPPASRRRASRRLAPRRREQTRGKPAAGTQAPRDVAGRAAGVPRRRRSHEPRPAHRLVGAAGDGLPRAHRDEQLHLPRLPTAVHLRPVRHRQGRSCSACSASSRSAAWAWDMLRQRRQDAAHARRLAHPRLPRVGGDHHRHVDPLADRALRQAPPLRGPALLRQLRRHLLPRAAVRRQPSRVRALAQALFLSSIDRRRLRRAAVRRPRTPCTGATLPFEANRAFSTYGNPDLLGGFLIFSVTGRARARAAGEQPRVADGLLGGLRPQRAGADRGLHARRLDRRRSSASCWSASSPGGTAPGCAASTGSRPGSAPPWASASSGAASRTRTRS